MAPPPGSAPLPGPLVAPLLVALGAVPGACLRFWLVNRLEPYLPRRHWGTLVVNLLACFALGLLLGSAPGPGWPEPGWPGPGGGKPEPGPPGGLELLLATGFLGSFSTFSSLAAELYICLVEGQRRQALALGLGSLLGGLLLLRLGQLLQGRWLLP